MERLDRQPPPRPELNHAEQAIKEVEKSKARIYDVQGRSNVDITYHSALLDEDHLLVGNYVDEGTRTKIGNGEYIDFAKLMPKDRIGAEDEHRMEMVNKGGFSYWVPVSDHENVAINSYARWEQAFRVFSNIYTEFFPLRSNELIQYNHIIHTTSQTFSWDNVYRYDREFRVHMSRHQNRNWGVILQQAWSMFLKDKIGHYSGNRTPSGHSNTSGNQGHGHGGQVRRQLCFDYNAGNCTFGKKCKFDHRCSFCNKFGHGSFNCRKAKANRGSGGGITTPPMASNNMVHNNFEVKDKNRWDKYEKETHKPEGGRGK